MSSLTLGKLVFLNVNVTTQASTYKHMQSTLISGSWLDVILQLPTRLFEKPKTITVSHNRQSWEQRLDQLHLPVYTSVNGDQTVYCPLPHQNTLLYPPFALGDVCQDGLHTKNKQASHCNSKRNGCGFGRGGRRREEGCNGK